MALFINMQKINCYQLTCKASVFPKISQKIYMFKHLGLSIMQINYLIQSQYKSQNHMQRSLTEKQKQSNHIQQQVEKIQYNCINDLSFFDDDYSQEHINELLHPSTIFYGENQQLRLDRYIRVKLKDKPIQSLDYIIQKKNMFSRYIGECEAEGVIMSINNNKQLHQHQSRQKQQFMQNSFYRSIKHPIVIFIKIISSKACKCNIQVTTLRGQILKYYSNIFLMKKQGKLLKLIDQFKNSLVIIHDFTRVQATIKILPTLIHPKSIVQYSIFDRTNFDEGIIHQTKIKIQTQQKGEMQLSNNNVIVRTKRMSQLYRNRKLDKIMLRIEQLNEQQKNYLNNIRGELPLNKVILAFDAIIINLWRRFNCERQILTNKINQLFRYKQNSIKQMIIEGQKSEHELKRKNLSQNCSLCISKQPRVERPRRTYWICQACSAEDQRPLYLCKKCFKSYHQNRDLFIYRKYQKKTKKLRLLAKKKNLKIFKDSENLKTNSRQEVNQKSSPQEIMISFNHSVDEYMEYIDKLMKASKIDAAQFYLHMLINSFIKKNNEFLDTVESK